MAHGIFSCSIQTLSCGMWDLVPWPGIRFGPLTLRAENLSHWTPETSLTLHSGCPLLCSINKYLVFFFSTCKVLPLPLLSTEKKKQQQQQMPFSSSIFVHLLFFCFLVFYWRIIALQDFVVFSQTSTWISHRYTHILFLLNLSPISLPIPPL